MSIRACKILLMAGISLVAGAAMSHAIGRSIILRGPMPETEVTVGQHE
jgi:hypothetical protein